MGRNKIAQEHFFKEKWSHIDTDAWPGRELLWLWCHPVTAGMILATFVGTLLLYWTGS